MSVPSREEILLEEWKAAEGTIRNFDSILTNIRFYGTTVAVALMSAAAESLRSTEAIVSVLSNRFYVASFIQIFASVFIVVLWVLHAHYLSLLGLVVQRQRDIEEKELLVQGKNVLRLGGAITRKRLPRLLRDPWNYLFLFLLMLAVGLAVACSLIPANGAVVDTIIPKCVSWVLNQL